MIAQRYRFHGYNALQYVYRQGRTNRSPCCLLRYSLNPRRTDCRVAVVVSKKLHKSAVVRNRIRRRIFASVQGRVADLPAYDLVFTVTDGTVATVSKKDIDTTISQLLQIITTKRHPVDKSV